MTKTQPDVVSHKFGQFHRTGSGSLPPGAASPIVCTSMNGESKKTKTSDVELSVDNLIIKLEGFHRTVSCTRNPASDPNDEVRHNDSQSVGERPSSWNHLVDLSSDVHPKDLNRRSSCEKRCDVSLGPQKNGVVGQCPQKPKKRNGDAIQWTICNDSPRNCVPPSFNEQIILNDNDEILMSSPRKNKSGTAVQPEHSKVEFVQRNESPEHNDDLNHIQAEQSQKLRNKFKTTHPNKKRLHGSAPEARFKASSEPGPISVSDQPISELPARLPSPKKRKLSSSHELPDHRTSLRAKKVNSKDKAVRFEGIPCRREANPTVSDVVREQTLPSANCQLPFNGHNEDCSHFNLCEVVSLGLILSEEHEKWFKSIASHSGTARIINLMVGSSCQQIILNSKCTDDCCSFKHSVELSLDFPEKHFKIGFNILTKWLLEKSKQPDFKTILLMLSRLPTNHDNMLMIVLSFAKMLLKLPNALYRQALGIKLVQILANSVNLQPWEAVRTLLVFLVTRDTKQSEIADYLSSLDLSEKPSKNVQLENNLYASVSCLWHINDSFVCPPNLLLKIIKECLVRMPEDLKFTKDRMVADLMKLPRSFLSKEFLLVEKFLNRYYPQNSEITHVVRTSVLYGIDPTQNLQTDRETHYEFCRVKGTGPVNNKWDYWDINESRLVAFDLVMKNRKSRQRQVDIAARRPTRPILFETLEDDVPCENLFNMLSSRSVLSHSLAVDDSNDLENLRDSLHSGRYSEVVKILSSYSNPNKGPLELCLLTLQQELELCDKTHLSVVVFEILSRLKGPLSDEFSVRSSLARMVNSLVMKFYKDCDYKSGVNLLKAMRLAGINHLEHIPQEVVDQETFTVICSEINFECRLYSEAIRSLMYKDCLKFVKYDVSDQYFSRHFYLLERVVMNMFKTFLKQRLAAYALEIFRAVLIAQESLHFPLDIGKFYEGTLFISFVSDLRKNACAPGEGANLYVLVDRICGNDEKFHSITNRSLLVELRRSSAPDDVIRRTLLVCLKTGVYPDFTTGPMSPLVLGSQFAEDEMFIYIKHYFAYFLAQNDSRQLTSRPFLVQFSESPPPDEQPFPIPNDVMKTSRNISDAVDRFRTVLEVLAGHEYDQLHADFSEGSVTIPEYGMDALLQVLKD